MKRMIANLSLGLFATLAFGQAATKAPEPQASEPSLGSILSQLTPREIGPTTMGGRVSQIAVYEADSRIFFVAAASGGLWRTENGGITFEPIFQYETTVALGAVSVNSHDPLDIWVGTGEQNSRNSTSWGDGIYHTVDGGKVWTHLGLQATRHISKIILDPKDPKKVTVAALGQLWGPNPERGIYQTTDGGKSWVQIFKVDANTGVVDLVADPNNPNVMIAAAYERRRWAYKFASGGPGSGMYKTTDGGKTWRHIVQGLPSVTLGRIGLSVFLKNPKVWVATVEADDKAVKATKPENTNLSGLYKSTDGGESWKRLDRTNPRPFYFSHPAIDPLDEMRVYVPGTEFHVSKDGGNTFRAQNQRVHVDYHAIWIDPKDSNHLLVGSDGGAYQTRDRGAHWEHFNQLRLGQFYSVTYDMRKPYFVYGGLQDNGSWAGPTQTLRGGVSYWDWYGIGGGDGFHVQVDPENWRTVYSESQGGAIMRIDQQSGESRFIQPRIAGEKLRFNWSTPILISPWNSATLYVGANRLFKSTNRGANWKPISPDLTTNDVKKQNPLAGVTMEDTGAERHCTIITVSESSLKQDQILVGTDDGLVQITEDGGTTWANITSHFTDLPANSWCSRVLWSKFDPKRAYATFDGHRNNDYVPYLYTTEDAGKTWTRMAGEMPLDNSCYVIEEGRLNQDLLFLGTELGLYVSLDRGKTWTKFNKDQGFPTVRVDDVTIHPRDFDLIIGTHGRSIWIVPEAPLEQLTAAKRSEAVFLCKPTNLYVIGRVTGTSWDGDRDFVSPNTQPEATFYYWLKTSTKDKVSIEILDAAGKSVGTVASTGTAGLNKATWHPFRRAQLVTGDLTVILKVGTQVQSTSLRVENVSGSQEQALGPMFDEDGNVLPTDWMEHDRKDAGH